MTVSSMTFDESYYLTQNPDVLTAVLNGIFTSARQHFDLVGFKELRDPNANFDVSYYLTNNTDVLNAGVNAFDHFLTNGVRENRAPTEALAAAGAGGFDETTYLSNNTDVQAAVTAATFVSGYQHWILIGQYEGRPSAQTTGGTSLVSLGASNTQTAGSTFTLTTGVDNLTGTANNDTFSASQNGATESVQSYQTGDTLNGGGGTDVLKLTVTDNSTAPAVTTTAIENFSIQTTVAETVSALNWASPSLITNNASTNTLTVSNVSSLATVGLSGVVTNGSTTTVQYNASLLTGSADTVNISLSGSTDAGAVRADANTAAGGVETYAITSTGTNKIAALTTGTDGKTVTFAGSGDLTVTATIANATTLNGSSATGKLVIQSAVDKVAVTGGSGADTVTLGHATGTGREFSVSGGAGNDRIVLTNLVATNDLTDDKVTLTGEAGTDTLAIKSAFGAVLSALSAANYTKKGIANTFETLEITDQAGAADAVGIARLGSNITTVDYAAGLGDAQTLTGLASGGTVVLGDAAGTNTDSVTVTVLNAAQAGSTADVLNVKLDALHAGAGEDYGVVVAAAVETINLNSTTTKTAALVAADVNTVGLTVANATTLNISGNTALVIDTPLTGGSLATVDASSATGNVTVSVAGATQGITMTGGSGVDTLTGGNGADAITGGAGNDVIVGGAGNDTINISGGGSNNVTLAAGSSDTITGFAVGALASSGDVLNLSGLTAAAGTANLTAVSATGATALTNNNLFIADLANTGKDFGGADFAELFGAGKAFATTDATANAANAIVLVRGATDTQVYVVDQSDGDAIDASDVELIGVLSGINNASTFVAANFDIS